MSLLPDIEDGKLLAKPEHRLYTPPHVSGRLKDEVRLSELNNHDRPLVTEDFGDSKFADRRVCGAGIRESDYRVECILEEGHEGPHDA